VRRANCFKFKTVEFWAEKGRVMVLDTRKVDTATSPYEAIRSLRPKEFMKRALAVYALSQEQPPSERFLARKLMDEAEVVFRQAMEAGDIGDPDVFEWHVRNQMRKSSILVPQTVGLVKPAGASSRAVLKREPSDKILLDGYTIIDYDQPSCEAANDTQTASSSDQIRLSADSGDRKSGQGAESAA